MSATRGRRCGRRGLAVAVALALVALQTLGLLHRIAHGDRLNRSGVAVAAAAFRAPESAIGQALFLGHDRPHDCEAFDQLSHTDFAIPVALAVTGGLPPSTTSSVHAAWHVAAQAHGFLARAPPADS